MLLSIPKNKSLYLAGELKIRVLDGDLEIFGTLYKKGDEIVAEVLEKARPLVELKPRRVGGATYQIPVEVEPQRGITIALMWLVKFARKRGEKRMEQRLAKEMLDILQGQGATMKKREETHKMAEANRAFAHFRW